MGKKGKEAARERREQRRREVALLRAVPYEPHQRWWDGLAPARAVEVVTGANGGIGYEIALHVVLTPRDATRGQSSVDELREAAPQEAGVSVEWMQLEVTDASVEASASRAAQTHGGIHVLV